MKSVLKMEESKKSSQKDLHPLCFRCGRKLKTEQSRLLGMGPTCYQKWQTEHNMNPLFNTGEIDGE